MTDDNVEPAESVTPNGAERPNRGALNDEERKARRFKALDLRLQHTSYRAIAAALDVDLRTAWEDVQWALDHEDSEAAEQVRRLELRRIDILCEKLWPACTGDKPDEYAIDRWLHLSKRRAALLGLDAPEKLDIVGAEITLEVVGTEIRQVESQEPEQIEGRAADPKYEAAIEAVVREENKALAEPMPDDDGTEEP